MPITAADVKSLREKTGVGMMECKKALTEAAGDFEKAIDLLREKGLAASQKKAGRIAAEGVVVSYYDEAKKVGVLVEVNSETDFVGKNEKFRAFAGAVAETVAKTNPGDVDDLLGINLVGSDRTVQENLQDLVLSIGENIKIRRFERREGIIATYIHGNGTVGVMVQFDTDDATAAKDEFKAMGKDVAMQVAAMNPLYLDPASVPADVLDHEKGILLVQMEEDPKMKGKPQQVLEGIVKGKLGKYYKENCLTDQEFVKSTDHSSVSKYIADTAKALGADIKLTGYTRFAKGEGLEKKSENFADEIKNMVK